MHRALRSLCPVAASARSGPARGSSLSELCLARAAFSFTAAQSTSGRTYSTQGTLDSREAAKFEADAALWWDESKGPFAPLHKMNAARCKFIRETLCRHFGRDPRLREPLSGLRLLDVGCGGGLLVEPLARMGAHVTGVDAVEKSIRIAEAHARLDPVVASRTAYRAALAEQLVAEGRAFDCVVSLEVVEHVSDVRLFVSQLAQLAAPGGCVIVSTINRTARSFALGIVAAERVLGWVPAGTHEWEKFLQPEELAAAMAESGLLLHEIAGMDFRPVTRDWVLSGNLEMNYIAFAKRVVAAEEGGGPGDGGAPQQGGGGGEEAGGRRAGANEAAPA